MVMMMLSYVKVSVALCCAGWMCATYFEELLDVLRANVDDMFPQSMAQLCQRL
jgi:hypothetical protein